MDGLIDFGKLAFDEIKNLHQDVSVEGCFRSTTKLVTSFTTGSKTSLRRRLPGIESSPWFRPTEGSWGSSTLKQVKWNMLSRRNTSVTFDPHMEYRISLTVIFNPSIVEFVGITERVHWKLLVSAPFIKDTNEDPLKYAKEAGSR